MKFWMLRMKSLCGDIIITIPPAPLVLLFCSLKIISFSLQVHTSRLLPSFLLSLSLSICQTRYTLYLFILSLNLLGWVRGMCKINCSSIPLFISFSSWIRIFDYLSIPYLSLLSVLLYLRCHWMPQDVSVLDDVSLLKMHVQDFELLLLFGLTLVF